MAILALACVGMLGSYYCYDIPSALNDQITHDLDMSDTHFNLLYSVYSFPNVILPLFGGAMVDYFGTNLSLFIFGSFITIGQAIFAIGLLVKSYPVMIVGRIFFGFGGESLSVAQTTLVALWFQDKELALALGINLSISRLGSVINDNVSPAMYDVSGLSAAGFFGLGVCVLSMLCILALIYFDRATMAQLQLNQTQQLGEAPESDPPIRLSDIRHFSLLYWLVTLSCVVIYSAVLPFNGICQKLLIQRFNYDKQTAGLLLGIPFFISAFASPFLGGAVDYIGWRAFLQLASACVLAGAHALLGYTKLHPAVALAMIGCAYSVLAAAIWPSISYVVPKQALGSAYGLTTSIQNMGLAVVPLLVGYIHDNSGSWVYVETFFFFIALAGIAIGIVLNISDRARGSPLNRSYLKDTAALDSSASDPLLSSGSDKLSTVV